MTNETTILIGSRLVILHTLGKYITLEESIAAYRAIGVSIYNAMDGPLGKLVIKYNGKFLSGV